MAVRQIAEAKSYSSRPRKVPFEDLTEDSIRCRLAGHYWRPFNAEKVVGGFDAEEMCERCRTKRVTTISNRGEVMRRRYKYADRYLSPEGRLEASDRDVMRLQIIQWDYKLSV